MYTQCPHCRTIFRIGTEQLRAAGGRARCCRCSEVFNALEHLRDGAREAVRGGQPAAGGGARTPAPGTALTTLTALPPDPLRPPAAPAGADTQETGNGERADAERHEPPRGVAEGPEAPAEDQAPESAAQGPTRRGPDETDGPDLPFHVPEGLPDIEPTEAEESPLEETGKPEGHSGWAALGWGLGAVLLLVLALGQLLWWEREALAQHPQGRKLVEPMCEALGCRVAPRRAPERIRVLSRDVSPHPAERDALLVMLVMANEAPFPQPYPVLQLTLYDEKERPFGQRRFIPPEYLRDAEPPLMQPDHAVYVRLELVDPGEQVTGFQFEFL
jgi:predicted Zn finger-like uncharacterized protein